MSENHCTTLYTDVHIPYSGPMSTSITVSAARGLLPQIVQRVLAGEEVTLTRHGQPVAVVVRPDRLRARRADSALAVAADLHEVLETGRERPLGTLSPTLADAVLRDVKRSRAR